MSDNRLGIFEKYRHEIEEIEYKLSNLENNRYYEHTGAKMDGSVSTNAQQLRKMIRELLLKIDKQAPSNDDEMASLFDNE